MEAEARVRVLWVGEDGGPEGAGLGAVCVDRVGSARAALAAAEAAQGQGDPYAVCWVGAGAAGPDAGAVDDLLCATPSSFLVVEDAGGTRRNGVGPGAWASPERCIALPGALAPELRAGLLEHLVARWQREEQERVRLALLEAEARESRASGRCNEERLGALYGVVEKIHGARGLEEALPLVLGEMARLLGARTGSLLLLERPGCLRVREAVGPNRAQILGLEVALQDSKVSRHALAEGRAILIHDIANSDRFTESDEGIRYRARSIVSVPLIGEGGPLGVLNFGGDARAATFTDAERDLAVTMARQVAVALEKARLVEGLCSAVEQSIRALAGAIEAKDPYTRGHSDRVTRYARRIARSLGLGEAEEEVIVRAAILHDVGKIGVPGAVLNKPGRLDADEYAQIQRHPLIGVEIVREIAAMDGTLDIIRTHHERIDGKGYPEGLAGSRLPVGARILAVADTFDAMTSDRPYRSGLPAETACAEIERCSGSQFDPEVARAFLGEVESIGGPGSASLGPAAA